jgi:CRISPR-associated protein Cas1
MPPLYIVQQNTKIRIRNRRLQVERDPPPDSQLGAENPKSEILISVPIGQVTQVVLFGNISLTTPAIDSLLAQNAEVVFLTQNGEYRGELIGSLTPHVPMRRAQYARLSDPAFTLEMAKCFVTAKVQHQRAFLLRHTREERSAQSAALSSIEHLERALQSIPQKTTLDSLRGVEGSATAAYFSAYRTFFTAEWKFNDRNRRPPADPVNVLLSFGYTLLAQLASGAIQTVGLDPFVGFLHEVVYNRPALALDLMEEFRPVVDGVVLWCCRGGILTPGGDFTLGPPERPIILDDDGKRRFLQAYQQRMDQTYTHPLRGMKFTLRQCLIEQSRQVADSLLGGNASYQGMGFR